MKSYNCFYSALFDVLEPSYQKNTSLLINNRWQFFYNTNKNYSDDRRILGEYPLLFDSFHLEQLYDIYNIQIQLIKVKNGFNELSEYIQRDGHVIVFANKHVLSGLYKTSQEGRCVTTIKIDNFKRNNINYSVFDSNMPTLKNDISIIKNAWTDASDYPFLNKSIIKISIGEIKNCDEAAKVFFWNSLKNSIKNYMNGLTEKQIINGYKGLNAFASALCDWDQITPQKLIDCSMYIEFIIKQRESIRTVLEYVCSQPHYNKKINSVNSVIELWKKVKMFFFIVGKREQYESIKFISDQVRVVSDMEYACLTDLMKIAGDNI
jgi:hypothetical protein